MNAKNLLVGLMVSAMALGAATPALAAEEGTQPDAARATLTASIAVGTDMEIPEGSTFMTSLVLDEDGGTISLDDTGELPGGVIYAMETTEATAAQSDGDLPDGVEKMDSTFIEDNNGEQVMDGALIEATATIAADDANADNANAKSPEGEDVTKSAALVESTPADESSEKNDAFAQPDVVQLLQKELISTEEA